MHKKTENWIFLFLRKFLMLYNENKNATIEKNRIHTEGQRWIRLWIN